MFTAAQGTQASEQWWQGNDIPTETLEATTTTNQRVHGLTLQRPSPPHRVFSHSASSVWGWGAHRKPRKTSLHGTKHQLKWGWQRHLPSSPGGGKSHYIIPHLDCKLSKHKAQAEELPAPTKEAKGKAGVCYHQNVEGLKKGRFLPQNILHRNTSE